MTIVASQVGVFRHSGEHIEELTGHEYCAVVCNGTAALAGAVATLPAGTVWGVPEVACRSLSQSVIWGGGKLSYYATDAFGRGCLTESIAPAHSLVLSPWFLNRASREMRAGDILDLSVNVCAVSGSCMASVTSLGLGKPAYWPRRGALVTARDAEVASALSDIIVMDSQWDEWTRLLPRITMIETTVKEVDTHIGRVMALRSIREEKARRFVDLSTYRGWPLEFPREIGGNSILLPCSLRPEYEVESLAVAAGLANVPLGRQPVRPVFDSPLIRSLGACSQRGVSAGKADRVFFAAVNGVDDCAAIRRLDSVFVEGLRW